MEYLKFDTKDRNEKKDEACAMFIGRVLQALVNLCPHLQRCVSAATLAENNKVSSV